MRLTTPAFWYQTQSPNYKALALAPLSFVYQCAHNINVTRQKTYSPACPVICIGNLTVGGTGKTPAAIAVHNLIKPFYQNPAFLTRGYGGNIKQATAVNTDTHDYRQAGDEALLLAKHAKTIISPNRKNGAEFAKKENVDLIIMDDGLQNPSLHKTLSLCVVDGLRGFGNGKTIPAGPLREPLSHGIEKTDAFIIIGDDKHQTSKLIPDHKPIFHANIAALKKAEQNKKYIGFAGIGHPEKFKNTLLDEGYSLQSFYAFPDHHRYTQKELDNLSRQAKEEQATLITTEKDFVRLPQDFITQNNVEELAIALEWKHPEELLTFLKQGLKL